MQFRDAKKDRWTIDPDELDRYGELVEAGDADPPEDGV